MVSTAVDASAVARVVGIKTSFKNLRGNRAVLLPQRIALVGQGATASSYSTSPTQITSSLQAGQLYGYGSPIHLAALQLLPLRGDGVGTVPVTVYPLEDAGSSVAAAGDITPVLATSKAASYRVRVAGIMSLAFVVEVGDAVADVIAKMLPAINGVPEMPVVAADGTTAVDLTAKWKGASGNDLLVEVLGATDAGVTWTVTQPTGGLINPDVDDALNQVGNVWETLFLNCMEPTDTTTLDKFNAFGEGRWGSLVHKPMLAFVGNQEADVNTAITVTDARKSDRVNVQLVSPGSPHLPLQIAARQLVRIAVQANNNPPHDYGSQQATGLVPGTNGEQWTYVQRDVAVKGGSSTVEVRDGVVTISDVVTMYHPDGDPQPAFRFVVDVIRLMNAIFNIEIVFNDVEWDGKPLIPDGQPTSNPEARTPAGARAAMGAIIDGLGSEAIVSDPAAIKETIVAEIDSQNPKRLNMSVDLALSGNTNIKAIDNNFGFYFGG